MSQVVRAIGSERALNRIDMARFFKEPFSLTLNAIIRIGLEVR